MTTEPEPAAPDEPDPAEQQEEEPAPEVGYRTLHPGDEGPDVAELQRLLELVDEDGHGSGKFDKKTEAAVKRYQRMRGLPQQGTVGPATWAYLLAPAQEGN